MNKCNGCYLCPCKTSLIKIRYSNMLRNLALFTIGLLSTIITSAQETLPKFSASLKPNEKIIISWRNNYAAISQISIQRSYDSIKNFTTLLTVPDPSVAENGFVDAKAPSSQMFYRLFIVLDSGKYFFTNSKKPSADTLVRTEAITED